MAEIYSSERASLQSHPGRSSDSDTAVTDKPRSDCESPNCEIVASRQSK